MSLLSSVTGVFSQVTASSVSAEPAPKEPPPAVSTSSADRLSTPNEDAVSAYVKSLQPAEKADSAEVAEIKSEAAKCMEAAMDGQPGPDFKALGRLKNRASLDLIGSLSLKGVDSTLQNPLLYRDPASSSYIVELSPAIVNRYDAQLRLDAREGYTVMVGLSAPTPTLADPKVIAEAARRFNGVVDGQADPTTIKPMGPLADKSGLALMGRVALSGIDPVLQNPLLFQDKSSGEYIIELSAAISNRYDGQWRQQTREGYNVGTIALPNSQA